MKYEHTQKGYVIVFSILIVLALYMALPKQLSTNILIPIILIILVSFSTMKVTIDEKLKIQFGFGYRKTFDLQGITNKKIIKTPWYVGYGIRWWPNTTIYRVSGLQTVEFKYKGRKYRIGTDEPEKLLQALK